jgi:hypothetical protein
MRCSQRRKKAERGNSASEGGMLESAETLKSGLAAEDTRNGNPRAMMGIPYRRMGRSLGGLQNLRRMTAAPHFNARGVFIGGIRTHGRIVSARIMTGAPSGKPSGLPFPKVRSANLLGAAHPLAGVVRLRQVNLRRPVMAMHPSTRRGAQIIGRPCHEFA